ncbi:MAG: protein arginine kinase [Planctomycetota bacterium]|jgi:protein arginine kinase
MTYSDQNHHASDWIRDSGPEADVVISSRVRLARNIAGYPFLSRANSGQQHELLSRCQENIFQCEITNDMIWVELAESSKLDRQLLVERRLISHQHSQGVNPRGVALSADESVAIMVNEEDHLRIQVLRCGMQLDSAYQEANRVDDRLESRLQFAYSSRLGYLTACPTNVGTGIRVSVMLHLPGLKLTGEIERVRRAAKDMHLAIRGFYGEGTESVGDLFQVSNQTTLGRSEEQILIDFQDTILPQVIDFERRARQALAKERSAVLEDRVWRAWGLLNNARLLGSEETLFLLSHLRLGVCMGYVNGVSLPSINELLLLTQPAHMQKMAGKPLSGAERREMRARFVRERLAATPA